MYQTDRVLNPIEATGCYFVSITERAGTVRKSPIDAKEALIAFGQALKLNYTNIQCLCINPAGIFGLFNVKVEQKLNKGNVAIDKNYICTKDEIEILEYYHPIKGTHFVPGDGKGNVVIDVYSAKGSPIITEGALRSKRVFIVKGVTQ